MKQRLDVPACKYLFNKHFVVIRYPIWDQPQHTYAHTNVHLTRILDNKFRKVSPVTRPAHNSNMS